MDFPPENIKERISDLLDPQNPGGNLIIKISIGIMVLILTVLMFPRSESIEYPSTIGIVWVEKDLVAPFDFPIYKDPLVYQKERQEAIEAVPPVFDRLSNVSKRSIDSLKLFLGQLKSISFNVPPTLSDTVAGLFPLSFTDNEWRTLLRNKYISLFIDKCERYIPPLLEQIYNVGLLDRPKASLRNQYIAIRKGNIETVEKPANFFDESDVSSTIKEGLKIYFKEPDEINIAIKIIDAALIPNLQYNPVATNTAIQIAADNVPKTKGFVLQNERIIGKHERITEEIKLKLESFHRANIERGSVSTSWQYWSGIFIHVLIIFSLYTLYLYYFQNQYFKNNIKLLIIGIVFLIEIFFAYLSITIQVEIPLEYLIFVPAASMLFAIIFNSRLAFYSTVAIAFLIAGMRGNDYGIAFTSIVAGTVGASTVRDIKSRTQIFRSLIYIFIAYLISILAVSLSALHSIKIMATEAGLAFINAMVSPVLTYGILFFFERVFKITTDLTLVELSDFNNPLLVELSEQAPGTFHHSVTIGNLAEAAAEAIGANSILARVGGYYHDIGKIFKPEYFIENQVGPHSRHNRLKPRMSALIISSHVREGVELGRKRGLPDVVLDFIPQHHGTTRISFFFDKALKQAAKKPPKDPIREEDYLYPGPKPQTKEAGIVMLADSVEASTRTLTNLTPQKLEAAIDNMIKHRFMEGQLDECELTLRDLTKIKEAFLKILIGIHHQRIQYPEQTLPAEESGIKKTEVAEEKTAEKKEVKSGEGKEIADQEITYTEKSPGEPENENKTDILNNSALDGNK